MKLIRRKQPVGLLKIFNAKQTKREFLNTVPEWELNIVRMKPLEFPRFNLGVPLRKTDVN